MNRRVLILLVVGALTMVAADSLAQPAPEPVPPPPTSVVAASIQVEVGGVPLGDGVIVDLGERRAEVIQYQDGDDLNQKNRPGRLFGAELTLYRPLTGDSTLRDWFNKVWSEKTPRRSVALIFLDGGEAEITRWCYLRAWPTGYELISFDRLTATDGTFDYVQAGDAIYERVQVVSEATRPGC